MKNLILIFLFAIAMKTLNAQDIELLLSYDGQSGSEFLASFDGKKLSPEVKNILVNLPAGEAKIFRLVIMKITDKKTFAEIKNEAKQKGYMPVPKEVAPRLYETILNEKVLQNDGLSRIFIMHESVKNSDDDLCLMTLVNFKPHWVFGVCCGKCFENQWLPNMDGFLFLLPEIKTEKTKTKGKK